jgi:hypothetical protein
MKAIWIIVGIAAALAVLGTAGSWAFCSLSGLRALFEREVAELAAAEPGLEGARPTEAELAALPSVVRRYLEASGFADRPKRDFLHASYRAEMLLGGGWRPMRCEQFNSVARSTRIWYARIPLSPFLWVEGRHIYANGRASMLIKLGPVKIVDVSGPELAKADMITSFNDRTIFLPASLALPDLSWKASGAERTVAAFSSAGYEAEAVLSFGVDGLLSDFVTDSRGRLDGASFRPAVWSTPITRWRSRDGLREAVAGSALYLEGGKAEPYLRFGDPDMALEYGEAALSSAMRYR